MNHIQNQQNPRNPANRTQQVNMVENTSQPVNREQQRIQDDLTQGSQATSPSERNSVTQWLININNFKGKQNFFMLYMAIFEISFAIAFWFFWSSGKNFEYLLFWPLFDNIFNYIVTVYIMRKHPEMNVLYQLVLYFELPKTALIGIGLYYAFTGQHSY